jgi:hypothetical protein
MDFARAFSYVFQDPDWIKKLAVIALVTLIPVVGWFVLLGWSLEVTRHVIQRDPTPLPNVRFGEQLGHGFRGFLVGLVYAIPVILLQLPIILATSLSGNLDADVAGTLVAVVSVCCGGLIFIYAICLAVILPAAYANFVAQNRVGAGLKLGEIFGLLRAAPGAYLFVLLGSILAGFVASLGTILCVVGVLLTAAYAQAVMGHLYGQAYLEAVRNQSYR